MNDRNSTLTALNTLPASTQALRGFYELQHLRCQPLETATIQPPPSGSLQAANDPMVIDPLQITVLGIGDGYVDLGIYTHPSLEVQQGPKPNKLWRRKWRKAPFLRYRRQNKRSISRALLDLADDFCELRSLHRFCYQAVEDLLHSEGIEDDPHTLQGLSLFINWITDLDTRFDRQLDQLHKRQQPTKSSRRTP